MPRIQVRIEVQYRNGAAIDLVKCSKGWKCNAMVAAQGEEFWLWVSWVYEGWGAGAEFEEGETHLVKCSSVVEGGDGDVAAVEDGVGGAEGIEAAAGVEASEGGLAC